jgi:hypothetical protein
MTGQSAQLPRPKPESRMNRISVKESPARFLSASPPSISVAG